jgi:hypothetical protein
VITAENEENLQKAVNKLIKIVKEYNLTKSTKELKQWLLKENTL